MTALVIVIVLVAVVGLALAIAWPLLSAPPATADTAATADAGADEVRQIQDELDRSLQSITEIAFDRASGHLSDEDFQALDADERARAVELMRRRDALTPPAEPDGTTPP